jgi:hypothetical protein
VSELETNPMGESKTTIRSKMLDAGVTWGMDRHSARLWVGCKGPDRSGTLILMDVPDDVVLRRAWVIVKRRLQFWRALRP